MSTATDIRTQRVQAAKGAAGAGFGALVAAIVWLLKTSRRRVLPGYWAAAELAVAWLGSQLRLTGSVALLAVVVTLVAGGWRARSRPVRMWRAATAGVLGICAVATVAAGPHAMSDHPTWTVFLPSVLATILGWPWWHTLRYLAEEEPEPQVDETLSQRWAQRWQTEVVANSVCTGSKLTDASVPRPGVIEALIRLAPGSKPSEIVTKGPQVETALDLMEGSVGWRSTGRAAKLRIIIVERSHIADGVKWTGPTYREGRCRLAVYADGTDGMWTFIRPGFGVLNGLVVGSTGAGKSRALGVLIENLLHDGWMVVVADPQNGQSLPDWRNTVGEYHDSPQATEDFLVRYHAEVMHRSKLLADAGVSVYDETDPRVQQLGLRKMMALIDECQLVLLPENKTLVRIAEEIAATDRKTGAGLILATQLPQMRSLGGSIRLRDAVTAGNAFIMRLSNRGSGTTVLPDGFVGDPFAILPEINGKTTAGMGYLRSAAQIGMLCRVPMQDEATAAAGCPRVPVVWQVSPGAKASVAAPVYSAEAGMSPAAKLRAAFGVIRNQPAPQTPTSTPAWVLACLRKAPASAQALLDRPDCPVNSAQLYAVLNNLKDAERIVAPAQRGGQWTIAN